MIDDKTRDSAPEEDPRDEDGSKPEDAAEESVPELDETIVLPGSDQHAEFEVPVSGEEGVSDRWTVPEKIGPYRIKGLIGSGGMGAVYEAIQESPKRRVAIKVVKPGWLTESVLRRFEFETQVLGALRHPGIAQIYEAGTFTDQYGERPYFAMEYIPNARMLTDYVQDKNLTIEERLRLFIRVCDAVHYGHQKGVIHRDLKPENVLVDGMGNPKVIDFGVARSTDADLQARTMQTSLGQIIGTLQYMSPEQCGGEADDLDTRTDVYSLGMMFYEVICDRLPYDLSERALNEAMRTIREVQPARPSTITRVIRGDLETVALKALEKVRERRYDSAASFGRDIQRYLENEPIEARRASMGYHMLMFSRRHRVTVAAAAIVSITVLAALVLTSVAWSDSSRLNRKLVQSNQDLEIQTANAQKQLADNRRLARDTLVTTFKNLRQKDGLLDEKERLATALLEYYKSIDDKDRNPSDIASMAMAHQDLALALSTGLTSSEPDHDGAMDHWKQAESLWVGLVAGSPSDDLGPRQMLVVARRRIARQHTIGKEYFDAMAVLTPLAGEAEALYNEDRNDAASVRLVVRILSDTGDVRILMEDVPLAMAAYQKANQVLQRFMDSNVHGEAFRSDSAHLTRRIGDVFREHDPAVALESQVKSLELFQAVAQDDPESMVARNDVGWSHYYVGVHLADRERATESVDHLKRGWIIIVKNCALNPNNITARDRVGLYLVELRTLLTFLDAVHHLPEQCRTAILVLQPVTESNPDNLALAEVVHDIRTVMRDPELAQGL